MVAMGVYYTCMAAVSLEWRQTEQDCCHVLQVYSDAVEAEGSEQASVQTVGEGMVSLTHTVRLLCRKT